MLPRRRFIKQVPRQPKEVKRNRRATRRYHSTSSVKPQAQLSAPVASKSTLVQSQLQSYYQNQSWVPRTTRDLSQDLTWHFWKGWLRRNRYLTPCRASARSVRWSLSSKDITIVKSVATLREYARCVGRRSLTQRCISRRTFERDEISIDLLLIN